MPIYTKSTILYSANFVQIHAAVFEIRRAEDFYKKFKKPLSNEQF